MIRRPPRSTPPCCRRQRQMCIRDSYKDVQKELDYIALTKLSNSDQFKFDNDYKAHADKLAEVKKAVAEKKAEAEKAAAEKAKAEKEAEILNSEPKTLEAAIEKGVLQLEKAGLGEFYTNTVKKAKTIEGVNAFVQETLKAHEASK